MLKFNVIIRELAIFSFFIAAILLIVQQIPAWSSFYPFSWICWGFFVFLCAIMSFSAFKAVKNNDQNGLTNLSMGFIVGKMILSILLVFAYVKIMQPEDSKFLIPFFFIYFSFTIFEVYQIIHLGQTYLKGK